jgi:RNA polymerase sigma-70 factor (ECF subfamily)
LAFVVFLDDGFPWPNQAKEDGSKELLGRTRVNQAANMPDRTPEFVRLFAESAQRVRWFVRAAIPDPHAADEVFQETSAALWENFGDFQPGTNFTAWALQIAKFRVLKHRNQQARDAKVFGNELVDKLLADTSRIETELDPRRHWLADCFAQLSFPDRDLITRRYTRDNTSKLISQQLGRSESYVSKALMRIHRLLFECISRHEAEEGAAS